MECERIGRRGSAGEPAEGETDGETNPPLHGLKVVELTEARENPREDQRDDSPPTSSTVSHVGSRALLPCPTGSGREPARSRSRVMRLVL